MMMNRKCLYCYKQLEHTNSSDFHETCSLHFFGTSIAPKVQYTFEEMAVLAKEVVRQHITIPGVQPKLSLTLINEIINKRSNCRLTVIGALEGNFIFKPPTIHFPEMPQNEHVTMRMAEAFKIKTVPSSLIRLKSGELAYITKRIDRCGNGDKIHMLDMFQITEAYDKYKSSMEKVGKALHSYSSNTLLDKLIFFELTIFCFLTGNNDMHLKNFSMINENDQWKFSPAYDLLNASIVNPKDTEELALNLDGKKKKFTKHNFENFGKNLGLNEKQIAGVFKRMIANKPVAIQWIENSFLSEELRGKYLELMEKRFSLIGAKAQKND
jgi:serine/threonine-protein kinase HipA